MKKKTDPRELSQPEIEKKIRDTRAELVGLRLRKQTGQLENPHLIRENRRELARLHTILGEKNRTAATQ